MRRRRKGPLTRLATKLDRLCAQIVKERDGWKCQHCGRVVEGVNAHCAHIMPRSSGNSLRWDLRNMLCLCFHCHINWAHKNPTDFTRWLEAKYPERMLYLQMQRRCICKWTKDEREGLVQELTATLQVVKGMAK